jgi:hypothetical protein
LTNILIVTDRSTHSSIESIYTLARNIADDSRVEYIFCINRNENENWLKFLCGELFSVRRVDSTFKSNSDRIWNKYRENIHLERIDSVFMRMDRPLDEMLCQQLDVLFDGKIVLNSLDGILKTSRKL